MILVQVCPFDHWLIVVSVLCDLTVDLRMLPPNTITERKGPKGTYYQVDYDLGIELGPAGIEFKFLYQGRVMGWVDAKYS